METWYLHYLVLLLMHALLTGLVAVAVLVFAYYLFKVRAPHESAKRRAENKVRMSDPILRDDIEILARTNSQLLDGAIALRCAQMELGWQLRYLNPPLEET